MLAHTKRQLGTLLVFVLFVVVPFTTLQAQDRSPFHHPLLRCNPVKS